ncbi:MAG: helix-turn-helix domain-containing protein [Cetobacterium sp.]|uniref:helix-turn-helix domain-containing protein n=1 Tax=Cetobacterium sp. TaxID=2071632 RepID=UPI003F2BD2F6
MIDSLKQAAELIYKNHNSVIKDKLNNDYEIGNITMYVHQDKDRISITALNTETQRQINLTAKKYSKLFNKYSDIGHISYSYKNDMPKVIINLIEQSQKVEELPKAIYRVYYKHVESGDIYYRDFETSKRVDYFIETNKVITVKIEEIKEFDDEEDKDIQKLKSENINSEELELLEYLKLKFGEEYINKTKIAIEQLENEKIKRSFAGRKAKFTEEQVNKILELRADGRTIKELSIQFQCGVATIHKLINSKKNRYM